MEYRKTVAKRTLDRIRTVTQCHILVTVPTNQFTSLLRLKRTWPTWRPASRCNQANKIISLFVTSKYKIIYFLHYEGLKKVVSLISSAGLGHVQVPHMLLTNPTAKCKFAS